MDRDTIWQHIHTERRALAAHLAELTPAEWAQPSLCAGWTLRDVAAHVISTPQIGWREVVRMTPAMLRGYDRAIFADVKRRGTQPVERILADFATYDGSRHHVPVTTHVEPLVDVLVHTQDALRPLGRRHAMPPEAAAVAADRAHLLAGFFGSARLVRSVRMVATDADWARGRGPVVEGPMEELLMLCCNRPADVAGLEQVPTAPGRRTGS